MGSLRSPAHRGNIRWDSGQLSSSQWRCPQSRYHLTNELDASLKRLRLDHIDLYQLQGFDPLPLLKMQLCLPFVELPKT